MRNFLCSNFATRRIVLEHSQKIALLLKQYLFKTILFIDIEIEKK